MAPFIENIGNQFGIFPAWLVLFTVIFLRYALLATGCSTSSSGGGSS